MTFENTFIYIVFEKWEKLAGAFVFQYVYGNLMFLDVCSEGLFSHCHILPANGRTARIFHGNASACHHLSTAFKAIFKSSSLFTPPPKSTTKEVRVAILSNTRWLTTW